MRHTLVQPTPAGDLFVEVERDGAREVVVGAGFGTPPDAAAAVPGEVAKRLAAWADGDVTALEPVEVRQPGTAFQQAVWQALVAIPAGETRSYAEIAAAIGRPGAVRAVGTACGRNGVAVLVPCHRVVRSDGTPGGYAFGNAVKRWLLAHERGQS